MEVGRRSVRILATKRLHLREMTLDDQDKLLEIFSDPVAMRYYPGTMGRGEAVAWIERARASYAAHGIGFWIVERKLDQRFLGQCGLILQDVDGRRETEVAYLFARANWGQGYATEAARACRDWGFSHLDVPRLVSTIRPENLPSIRVAERNGMLLTSSLVKPIGGLHQVYAITREAWARDRAANPY